MLGRTETRTRDRIYCQTMRTFRDISRDDRARIATCSLRTLTNRLKENYSIDYSRLLYFLWCNYVLTRVFFVFHFLDDNKIKRVVHTMLNVLRTNTEYNHDLVCVKWMQTRNEFRQNRRKARQLQIFCQPVMPDDQVIRHVTSPWKLLLYNT